MNHLQEIAAVVIVLASVVWLVRRGLRKAAAPCETCDQCGLMAAARGKIKSGGREAKQN